MSSLLRKRFVLKLLILIASTIINDVLGYTQCNEHGNQTALNVLMDIPLDLDNPIQDSLRKDQTRRYSLILSESSPILINMTQCTPRVTWNIFYNKTINFANQESPPNSSHYFSLACALPGRYDILITPMDNCKYRLSTSLQQLNENWQHLNRTQATKIRLQNRPQRRQVVIKWDKSKLDIHAMNYCLVVNTVKPVKSLCKVMMPSYGSFKYNISDSTPGKSCEKFFMIERFIALPTKIEKINPDEITILCTGKRTQQILRGLQINTPYFIDVFAVHTQLNNFSFILGTTRTWFNRTRSIILSEEKSSIGKLSDLGGLAVFSFKVPSKTKSSNFRLNVIPCGGSVDVKIMKHKQKILLETNVFKSVVINIPNVRPGERYIIRVTPNNEDEFRRVTKVEVTVSTKDSFELIPELPRNNTVLEIASARSCRSTSIAWFSSLELRKIRYCMFVIKQSVKNNDFDNIQRVNFCEVNSKLSQDSQFQQMHCFFPERRSEMQSLKLYGLSPGRHYMVHVTASLPNGRSLPYESARIKTDPICRRKEVLNNRSKFDEKNFISRKG